MVYGKAEGGKYADPVQGVKDSYNKNVTDEFIVPFVCTDKRGEPLATIRDDDSCICFNFRADRVRQITRALTRNSGLNADAGRDLQGAEDLDATIPRDRIPKNLTYICMTQYDKKFSLPVVIPPESMNNILANVMGQMNLPQSAGRGKRKICARHLFLQRRCGAAIPWRRPRAGAIPESCDLRFET